MAEGLGAWKENIRERLRAGWMLAQWAASQPDYATVSAAALWPVLEALKTGDPGKLFPALMTVVGGVGTNLVANQLQQWKDASVTPAEVAEWVRQEATANPAARAEIDLINAKLDTILEARGSVGDEQWANLAARLTGELAWLGNLPRFQASISGPVTVVRADHGLAVGEVHGIVAQHVSVNVVGDQWKGGPGPSPGDNLRIYLQVLASAHSRLPLRGLDVGAGEAAQDQPRLDLAQVYVALETLARVPAEARAGRSSRARAGLGDQEDRPLRALEAMAQNDRLVVLGDPGSGKSTLLNHLALCLAMHALDSAGGWLERLSDWPDRLGGLVPVIVVLRDFARAIRGIEDDVGPRHLWAFVQKRLADQNLGFVEPALHQAVESGGALVLLDGMDEIPAGVERERVREAVARFAARYSGSRHVVTCRTLSYQDRAWQLEEWPTVTLAPFDEAGIDRFIRAWHEELVRLGVIAGADAADLTAKLERAVRRPDLWRLAPNPLLLLKLPADPKYPEPQVS